jgi:hypothetical protein
MDRLLANHGFTVVERRYWEGGKREKWKFTLFSLLTVPLCWITGGRIMLTPGLTVLAKKVRPQTDVAARERTASAGEGTIAKEHP